MRAVLRLGLAIAAAGFALAQPPALAQTTSSQPSSTPPADAVGPRELQNFNLQGTITRPAEPSPQSPATQQPARPAPAAERSSEVSQSPAAPAPARSRATSPEPSRPSETRTADMPRPAAPPPATTSQAPRLSSITVPLPPVGSSTAATAPAPTQASFPNEDLSPTDERSLPVWPWLLAAIALGAGGAFLFWRRNARAAFAAGPRIDAFVAPGPPPVRPRARAPAPVPAARPAPAPAPPTAKPAEPAPAPAPPAAEAPPPAPSGLVSTRLRPWLDITLTPLRCVVEDTRVLFEFDVELFNSGSAMARDLLVEGMMFNAGTEQDREIGAFLESPVGEGDRIPQLPPMKRVNLRPQLVVGLERLRVLDAGGRRVFVPLIAFNALYRWSKGEGQTSAAYLLGREGQGEKLAPFRLDLGPRIFRKLGTRALPLSVRR